MTVDKKGTFGNGTKVLLSIVLALLFMGFMALFNNLPYALIYENPFFRLASTIKHGSSSRATQLTEKVLFINTGNSNMLIPAEGDIGTEVIANRSKLDLLLKRICQLGKTERHIIVNLLLDAPSVYDSLLAETIQATDYIYFPAIGKLVEGPLAEAVRAKKTGYVNYSVAKQWWKLSDVLLKFPLVANDTIKSLPLVIYEGYTGRTAVKKGMLLNISGQYFFNNIMVDEKIRSYALDTARRESMVHSLDFMLSVDSMDENYLPSLFAGKEFVVIGDFNRDKHKTAFGDVPGPVIVMNLVATLLYGENRITITWLLAMLVALSGIIHFSFFGLPGFLYKRAINDVAFFTENNAWGLMTYSLMFFVLAAFSYYVFQIPIEVVPLVLLMTTIQQFLQLMNKLLVQIHVFKQTVETISGQSLIKRVLFSHTLKRSIRLMFVLLLLIMLSLLSNAQSLKLITISGGWAKKTNGQLLKRGDFVNPSEKIIVSSASVVLAFLGPGTQVRFSKASSAGRPVISGQSELWMVLKNALQPVVAEKTLAGRNTVVNSLFELEKYLGRFQADTGKLLVVDKTEILLSEQAFSERNRKYFFMRYSYKGEKVNKKLAFREQTGVATTVALVLDTSLLKVDNRPVHLFETAQWQLFYYNEAQKEALLVGDVDINIIKLDDLQDICLLKSSAGNRFSQNFLQNYLMAVYGTTYDEQLLKRILAYSCK